MMTSLTVFNDWNTLTTQERRDRMVDFGVECKRLADLHGEVKIPLREWFVNGTYTREVFMPEGAIVIGEIHKTEHISIVSKGKVLLASEEGVEVVEAPYTYVNKVGAKRVLYIIEDTIWTTVHRTDETDVSKLRSELIADSYDDIHLNLE